LTALVNTTINITIRPDNSRGQRKQRICPPNYSEVLGMTQRCPRSAETGRQKILSDETKYSRCRYST